MRGRLCNAEQRSQDVHGRMIKTDGTHVTPIKHTGASGGFSDDTCGAFPDGPAYWRPTTVRYLDIGGITAGADDDDRDDGARSDH